MLNCKFSENLQGLILKINGGESCRQGFSAAWHWRTRRTQIARVCHWLPQSDVRGAGGGKKRPAAIR